MKTDIKMTTIGPYQKVLTNFYLKAHGEKLPKIKTALILVAGMQRGVIQAWACAELEKLGYAKGIDFVVGTSVGAIVGRELVGGNIKKFKKFFHAEHIQRRVISPRRHLRFIDFVTGEDMLRKEGSSEKAVKSAKTQLYIGLRDKKTGSCFFANAKDIDDTASAVISSMTMPGITKRRNLTVNGAVCEDPMHINRLPIRFAIEKLGATDVLVLLTDNPFTSGSLSLTLLGLGFSFAAHIKHPKQLLAIRGHLQEYKQNVTFLKNPLIIPKGARVAAFYPLSMPLAPDERRVDLIHEAGQQAAKFIRQIDKEVRKL